MWQDWVLASGGFVFAAALVPSLMSANKPSKWSCGMTALVLTVFAAVYATLGLWLTFLSTTLPAVLWFVLLGQTVGTKKP